LTSICRLRRHLRHALGHQNNPRRSPGACESGNARSATSRRWVRPRPVVAPQRADVRRRGLCCRWCGW
jgi:hypothetical protein